MLAVSQFLPHWVRFIADSFKRFPQSLTSEATHAEQALRHVTRAEERNVAPVRVNLEGRFMMKGGQERSCRVYEISIETFRFSSGEKPALGEKVIVYLAGLGRFEGVVGSDGEDGIAVECGCRASGAKSLRSN